ncbi:MAG TPA: 2TM domain-containing protein [Aggregatilineales bacterium]|nr:2TM domain-containing protein [Aggregatilineales bacterium]
MNDDINYDEIRKRVDKRVKDRVGFYTHVVIFIAINLMLWVICAFTTGLEFPWPLFLGVPWGVGLLAHGANVYFAGSLDRMREREVEREIEREHMRRGMMNGKRKNDSETPLRLSDEGELIPGDEGESPQTARRASRR